MKIAQMLFPGKPALTASWRGGGNLHGQHAGSAAQLAPLLGDHQHYRETFSSICPTSNTTTTQYKTGPRLLSVKQQLKPVIHVELLVAMEQRQSLHGGSEIGFDFPETLHQHDVL